MALEPIAQMLFWGVWAFCLTSFRCARSSRTLISLFTFCSVMRIGEAQNPGPDDSFILGIANPSGLRHKAPYISTHMAHGDLWVLSETHLTAKDVGAFEAGLRFAGAPFSRLIGGAPVPDKHQNAGSSWKGVGILSRFPTRRLPHD